MIGLRVLMVLAGGATLIATGARGESPPPVAPGCAEVVAVLDQGGGGLSAEEVARKTSTDIETVRSCTDAWRASQKDPKDAQGGGGGTEAMPAGCAKIVAVLDEGGGGLSADEVAKKTSTNVETVRDCTDRWRRQTKGGATP